MRPITINFANAPATGFVTEPVVLDPYTNPQSASVIANIPTAGGSAASLTLQVSNDDPFAPNFSPATATWLTSPSAFTPSSVTSATPSAVTLVSIPRMIRFMALTCVGSPTVSFKIVQGGLGGV